MVELQLVDYEGGKEGGGSVWKKFGYWVLRNLLHGSKRKIFERGGKTGRG